MQTFLPFSDYAMSAACLDTKRLNKQILEAHTLLQGKYSKTHPAALQWQGHQASLTDYAAACCNEYAKRYKRRHALHVEAIGARQPAFVRLYLVTLSHRVNLLRKDFAHYSAWFTIDNVNIYPSGYFWAVRKNGGKADKDSLAWTRFVKTYQPCACLENKNGACFEKKRYPPA